jgi:hypothetical protein
MNNTTKPKLVFFKFRNSNNLSDISLCYLQDCIRCLSFFFEVIIINEDCDYQQVCDLHQPDLAIFESGNNYRACYKIDIKNTHFYPEIPKVGFHNGDSWCEARSGFISDMEHWGIETFFSVSTTIAELTPEISERVFVWPNSIDPKISRDYGQSKVIPVMFNGKIHSLYPWREKIQKVVTQYYPSLICPHPGYEINPSSLYAVHAIYGEKYARAINASWFMPTCGTAANEIVRKHFEIPGSRSCLLTEKTPIVEAAGFSDMQNCVFADDTNVLDKLDYLFRNLDELEKIIDAGYQLVHSRHTLRHRDQIFQWFNLQKNLEPNQRIIQSGPFEPLSIVEESSGTKSNHIICDGLIIQLLHKGDEKLWAGKYKEALAFYRQSHIHIWWMPEPKLRLALCNLYAGNSAEALDWILQPIRYTLEEYKAIDPDPVEWAYLIITLICRGKLDKAIKCAEQFPYLYHPELDRARWVVNSLTKGKNVDIVLRFSGQTKHRYSVHQLPERSFDEWISQLCIMMNACKQSRLSNTLKLVFQEHELFLEKSSLENEKYSNNQTNYFNQELSPKLSESLSLVSKIFDSECNSLDRRIQRKIKKIIKIVIQK